MTIRSGFTGLYGRQQTIEGLEIPRWVTIYVPTELCNEISLTLREYLENTIEGLAVAGCLGVTVVFDTTISIMGKYPLDVFGKNLLSFIRNSRPFFRLFTCNLRALTSEPSLLQGHLLIIGDKSVNVFKLESFQLDAMVYVDPLTSLIAKTSTETHYTMLSDIYNSMELDYRSQRIWNDDPHSVKLLTSFTSLLTVNAICKPQSMLQNTFFMAADFVNEITAQAFNDRSLRIRRHRENDNPPVTEVEADTPDTGEHITAFANLDENETGVPL